METAIFIKLLEMLLKYLRHFHLGRVPKGDFQLLFVDRFFGPEGVLGNEDECDHVPKILQLVTINQH